MSLLKNKHILVVEDDEILREVICEEFITNECLVSSALSGNQAIKKIREESPFDIIVTDVQMPDGDGAFLLEQLKLLNLKFNPVVIMVSGYSDLPTEELIKKGAHVVLSKPFDLNDLIEAATQLLQTSHSTKVRSGLKNG